MVLFLFLATSTLFAFFDRYFIPPFISAINKLLFPVLFLGTIFMVLGNYYWYTTFSLHTFNIDVRNFLFVTLLSGFLLYLEYASRCKMKGFLNKLQYLGPPLLFITFIFIERFFGDLYYFLEKEDSVFETLQFIGYVLSGLLSLHIAFKLWASKFKVHAPLFMLLGFALLFITGEEISWGQRFFHLATPPQIARDNLQQELTIHNNKYIERKTYYLYMAIGIYGSFSWLALKLVPRKSRKLFSLFTPPPRLFFYFFPAFAFFFFSLYLSTYYGLFDAKPTSFDLWQELAELYIAVGFLQFTLRNTTLLKVGSKKK